MTNEGVAKLLDATYEHLKFLRQAGQKEYAHDEDNAFANFERVGKHLQLDRKKVLLIYMLKHVDGIVAAVNGHNSQREPVDGRILDCIVYLILLMGMFEDEEKEEIADKMNNYNPAPRS